MLKEILMVFWEAYNGNDTTQYAAVWRMGSASACGAGV